MAPRRGPRHLAGAAIGAAFLAQQALAGPKDTGKKVFAHYMVGDSTTAHRQQDIKDAKAIGLDGFSLNIGKPGPSFVRSTMNDMFDFAASNSFGLHASMDLWAAGDPPDPKSVGDYKSLFVDFFGHAAYEVGANGFPMVTTFADGGTNNKTWEDWREQFAQQVYVIPNLDGIPGYWEMHPGFWEHWGGVVDGLFTWESAWPLRDGVGGAFPGDIAPDLPLIEGMKKYKRQYMIGLSPLQYKDAYDTNIYRAGDVNLPTRMEAILKRRDDIHYVNIMTWNDGPESHYIGNIWEEQNDDPEPAHYMHLSHTGWQRLIGSFITAFKGDGVMRPFGGDTVTGAYWYKTILSDTVCSKGSEAVGIEDQYLTKPEGYDSAEDLATFALVLPEGASGWSLRVSSGGKTDTITGLKGGLNYGRAQLKEGVQRVEVVNSGGSVVATASGGRCVYGGNTCPDCTYNINPAVVQFTSGSAPADAECDESCTATGGGDWNGISEDGLCGPVNGGKTCIGSSFGSCCSVDGECSTSAGCGTGCQKEYGFCIGGKKQVDDGNDDNSSGWPTELVDAVCDLSFNTTDPTELSNVWIASGAATWFLKFLREYGATKWISNFSQVALGTSGPTLNCEILNSGNCAGPGSDTCRKYNPPSAYFVHLQFANLYSILNAEWAQLVNDAIDNLSGKISAIVDDLGTPPKDDNSVILNMLVGLLTSMAGISGGISDASTTSPLGKFANPLTFFAGMFAQMAADGGATDAVDADTLKQELKTAYGKIFKAIMKQNEATMTTVLGGALPDGWSPDDINVEDWVWSKFAKGEFMNLYNCNDAVRIFISNVQLRWVSWRPSSVTFLLLTFSFP